MSLKVGVLMGGESNERQVSIATGKAVSAACKRLGFLVEKLLFRHDYKKFINQLKDQDIIFNALHGGIGENGEIQAWLDKNNIQYTGSGSLVSALCMDKARSKTLARIMGFKTADWQLIENSKQKVKLDLPVVVKPNEQGSTFGLTIVKDKGMLKIAMEKAFEYGNTVIAERYIEGREITVPVLGNKVYPIIEIKPSHNLYDYECKYTPGLTKYFCPAELEPKMTSFIKEDTALLFNEFGCDVYSRIDYIIDNDGFYNFLELNTLPGMTKTSLFPKSVATEGLSFTMLIKKIIELSL